MAESRLCFGCSEVLLDEWKFCCKCGLKIQDSQREVIEHYFHLGYKYDTMVHLLQEKHKISMTVRTLKCCLATYRLSRKNSNPNEQEIKKIIRKESQGSGHLSGYRKMWHILRINHHMHVPRSLVAKCLREIDPESSQLRKKRKLK